LVEGSYKLAGADLMKNSTVVYQILRLNGYQEDIESLLTELGTRFARPRRKKVAQPDSLPSGSESKAAESSAPPQPPPVAATRTPALQRSNPATLRVDALPAAETQLRALHPTASPMAMPAERKDVILWEDP
jgi:hypothetical protein